MIDSGDRQTLEFEPEAFMVSSDDDDELARERLRQLGLLHLADQPEELKRALDRLLDERRRVEEEGERERLAIRARLEAEERGVIGEPARPAVAEAPRKKTSTLVIGTLTPGTCTTCRHSNQETRDFEEGHLFCWMAHEPKRASQPCDVKRRLPRQSSDDPAAWREYYLYEPYDGANGTYAKSTDLRMLAEDADDGLRKSLRAHLPIID